MKQSKTLSLVAKRRQDKQTLLMVDTKVLATVLVIHSETKDQRLSHTPSCSKKNLQIYQTYHFLSHTLFLST